MPPARAHLVISGRVQGVFYRGFAEDVAYSLGLRGWVRNRPEGTVEAVFEGERSSVEEAIKACRRGPPASRVKDVEVTWEDYRDEFTSFSVRYF